MLEVLKENFVIAFANKTHIYEGPSTKNKVIKTVSRGTRLPFAGLFSGQWLMVECDDQQGWISEAQGIYIE